MARQLADAIRSSWVHHLEFSLCIEAKMLVKVIGIDRASGKVRLSRREALGKTPDVVHNLKAGFST